MSETTRRDVGPVLAFLRVLWRVNHGMEKRSKHMQATLGVTAPQRMVVRMVGRFPGIYAGELADLLHVDRGTLSSALRRLEALGLLKRATDEVDRRRVAVSLTSRGKRVDAASNGSVESVVKTIVTSEREDALRATQRVLSSLANQLEQTEKRGHKRRRLN